jgi:hypothetical protein
LAYANRPKGAAPIYVGDAYLNLQDIHILKTEKGAILFLRHSITFHGKKIFP